MRRICFVLLVVALLFVLAAPALAESLSPPWDGNPISPLITPQSFGQTDWAGGDFSNEAVASRQGAPLALMPNSAVGPTLGLIQDEADAASLPARMTYWVTGQSAGGRDMYAVVINALETANQRRDYARWQNIRNVELLNPVAAQAMLDSYGDNIKMPVFIEANINGTEYEGTDAMMQVIRDLVTTPRGENATVDKILDHCLLVVVPTANPDGRVAGIRGNSAVADTNRDYFLQSQPEEQIDAALQQDYLAVGALHLHGYVTPTLIDGLTMPHNPGLQYDIFPKWNQRRTAQNKVDFNAMGYQMQRPVNDWNANGNLPSTGHLSEVSIGTTTGDVTEAADVVTVRTLADHNLSVGDEITIAGVQVAGYNGTFTVASVPDATHFTYVNATTGLGNSRRGAVWSPTYPDVLGPQVSQGWDDWGPFYGQTYMAMLGVDSSTVEMASTTRLVSKTAQYMAFYSSANYWLSNTYDMMSDQLETFRRGVENAPTDPGAIDKVQELVDLGFSDVLHNWMATYPTAYVIPYGEGQRSDAEANRLVEWCFANNIKVERMTSDFSWNGTTFQAGSYVVPMAQALRGLAWNVFSAGTDIETRITQLYASPAAWSHGLLWGADTVEIPRDDATFTPATTAIDSVNALVGGVRDGVDAAADFYSISLKGVTEDKAILALLRSGVSAEMAEEPFASTTGGDMPAGSLIFPADAQTAAALDQAGQDAGMYFERNVGVAKPATTMVPGAPKIAILANSVPNSGADTDGVLARIFGAANVQYVPTVAGAASLENASSNPLSRFNVIYNAGGAWPTSVNISASGATSVGTTATITTSAANNLAGGARITIAGVTESGYNGTYTVDSVVSTTQFTITTAAADLPASGSGTVTYTGAQNRLNAFFARGGGYVATNVSASNNFNFLSAASLVSGTLTQGSQSAYGGIAMWNNVAGAASPITGAYPAADKLFLPSSTTYFTATPTGAIVDAQYPDNIATTGPEYGYLAGMWLNRDAAANTAPVLVHGTTSADSRYMAFATNPTSRYDGEREWPLIVQAALWSDLTDEGQVAATITASAGANGTISPSGATMVAIGADETYTITPGYGYAVEDVTVDGQSVGAVTSFTFHNVADNHAIAASFVVAPMPWNVSLKLSKTTVKVNHSVKFSGSVMNSMSGPAAGKVKIQKKAAGGAWKSWKTATLNAKGNYSLTVKMTKKGTWYFRTMKAGDTQYVTSFSAKVRLKVK